jgi:hypothetical protein
MNAGAVLLLASAFASRPSTRTSPELSAGWSWLLYAHAFEYATNHTLSMTLTLPVARAYAWSSGIRFGTSSVAAEVFGRFDMAPEVGRWRPSLGIELGVTGLAQFDSGPVSRREMRRPIEDTLKPYYAAIHARPLSFVLGRGWRYLPST